MVKKARVEDVVEKIVERIPDEETIRRLTEKVVKFDHTRNPADDLTQQEVGQIYRDDDYGDELPLSRKRDVDVEWSNHAEYRSDLRDVNPDKVNHGIVDRLKNRLMRPEHRKETFHNPGATMVVDYDTGRNPAKADVVTVWSRNKVAAMLVRMARDLMESK